MFHETCFRVPTEVLRRISRRGALVLVRFLSEAYGRAGTSGEDGVLRIDRRLDLDAVTFTSMSVHNTRRRLMGNQQTNLTVDRQSGVEERAKLRHQTRCGTFFSCQTHHQRFK